MCSVFAKCDLEGLVIKCSEGDKKEGWTQLAQMACVGRCKAVCVEKVI